VLARNKTPFHASPRAREAANISLPAAENRVAGEVAYVIEFSERLEQVAARCQRHAARASYRVTMVLRPTPIRPGPLVLEDVETQYCSVGFQNTRSM